MLIILTASDLKQTKELFPKYKNIYAVMSVLIETLASYLPALTLRRYISNAIPLNAPVSERFSATVLFADISGFTALSDRLAQRGSSGIEELSKYLNSYFGQLIALITQHGGDIVKFAGDALLAIWPATEGDLLQQTMLASQCSLAILTELNNYMAGEEKQDLRKDTIYGVLTMGDSPRSTVRERYQQPKFLSSSQQLKQANIAIYGK